MPSHRSRALHSFLVCCPTTASPHQKPPKCFSNGARCDQRTPFSVWSAFLSVPCWLPSACLSTVSSSRNYVIPNLFYKCSFERAPRTWLINFFFVFNCCNYWFLAPFIFYALNFFIMLHLLVLAQNWPRVMWHWEAVELLLPPYVSQDARQKLSEKVKIANCIVLSSCLGKGICPALGHFQIIFPLFSVEHLLSIIPGKV